MLFDYKAYWLEKYKNQVITYTNMPDTEYRPVHIGTEERALEHLAERLGYHEFAGKCYIDGKIHTPTCRIYPPAIGLDTGVTNLGEIYVPSRLEVFTEEGWKEHPTLFIYEGQKTEDMFVLTNSRGCFDLMNVATFASLVTALVKSAEDKGIKVYRTIEPLYIKTP